MHPMEPDFHELERPAGPLECEPVDLSGIDAHCATVYQSYETYLREELSRLDRERPSQWHRDYSGEQAYLDSVAPMRERFKSMLGSWAEPNTREPVEERDAEILIEDGAFVADPDG